MYDTDRLVSHRGHTFRVTGNAMKQMPDTDRLVSYRGHTHSGDKKCCETDAWHWSPGQPQKSHIFRVTGSRSTCAVWSRIVTTLRGKPLWVERSTVREIFVGGEIKNSRAAAKCNNYIISKAFSQTARNSRSKHKKVQRNAYLFWHGHTIGTFSGKSPLSSHKRTLRQQLNS